MSSKKVDKTIVIQNQIRQNAEEVSTFLSDLSKWEKKIKVRDDTLRRHHNIPLSTSSAVDASLSNSKTIETSSINNDTSSTPVSRNNTATSSAAKHTYDIGYKKWENFDENIDLDEKENKEASTSRDANLLPSSLPTSELTPASFAPSNSKPITIPIPRPRNQILTPEEAELKERSLGNDEFSKGNFTQAIKHYTTCLGMKSGNVIAFSNRAMAYLKLKEYSKAEMDCNVALSINKEHIKSLQRRATARNALGKHRLALLDLYQAKQLDPENKQLQVDIGKTRELLRSSVLHAPMMNVPISISNAISDP